MTRIAVTGASGFIGRHVLDQLLAGGHAVTAASRSAQRLDAWAGRVRVVEMDIADPGPDALERLGRPDVLIHLAWGGLPNYRALRHFEEELPLQYRFLKGLVEDGLPALVATGTCFEYGQQSGRLAESLPACPTTVYGFAKDALRRQLEFLKATRPFRLTWGRLFYMYGEGQAPSSLYPQLMARGAEGAALFEMSSGEQLRDYLPVAAVADKLVALAVAGRDAGIVNVCAGVPVSVRSLVEGWIRDKGWSLALDRGKYPVPDYEPMAFWGDDTTFQSIIRGERG